jgi:hypothetical protein
MPRQMKIPRILDRSEKTFHSSKRARFSDAVIRGGQAILSILRLLGSDQAKLALGLTNITSLHSCCPLTFQGFNERIS